VSVWTFDYRQWSLDWVTKKQIGPNLAEAISCLAHTSGHKVVVVAHSMGGLATQYAVSQRDPRSAGLVASDVQEVLTFGTPYHGSLLLTAIRSGISALPSDIQIGVQAILAACAGITTVVRSRGIESTPCDLPAVADSPVGTALMYDSPEIAALPPWPSGLRVHDLAGQTEMRIGVRIYAFNIDVGDILVSTGSATGHDTEGSPDIATCTRNPIEVVFGDNPCYHAHLMSNPILTNQVIQHIERDVEAEAGALPVTLPELESAPVPSLRGNPAGHLVHGVLPNPLGQGSVELLTGSVDVSHDASGDLADVTGVSPVLGDLTDNGVADAAADIGSTSGAGGLDQTVALYANQNQQLTLLGSFDPAGASHAYHANVMAMAIRHETVFIDWEAFQGGNQAPSFWSAELLWQDGRVVVRGLEPHTGATGAELWSSPKLIITPSSLGGVQTGMDIAEAARASGLSIDELGSGELAGPAAPLPSGYASFALWLAAGSDVGCVIATGSPRFQEITTPEGFRLGGTVGELQAIYGGRAVYVPAPAGNPAAGYVVDEDGGALAFIVSNGRVSGIIGGPVGTKPSICGAH